VLDLLAVNRRACSAAMQASVLLDVLGRTGGFVSSDVQVPFMSESVQHKLEFGGGHSYPEEDSVDEP
jgi:hypothetical protein